MKLTLALKCASIVAVLLMLPGCVTTSLHPLYTEADIVADSNIEGEWGEPGKGRAAFRKRDDGKSYDWVSIDEKGKETKMFVTRIVNLRGQRFLDVSPHPSDGNNVLLLRPHAFLLIRRIGDRLQLDRLNERWLEKHLSESPEAPQHEKVDGDYIITATTGTLQAFLFRCVTIEGAFESYCDVPRIEEESSRATFIPELNGSTRLTDAESGALSAIQAAFHPGVRYSRRLNIDWDALESAANKGNADAMFHWGRIHDVELGLSADLTVSMKYYERAAEAGSSWGQVSMGYAHYNGVGRRKDLGEAIRWWRLAAEAGNATAQYSMGVLHENGEGVRKDLGEAIRWYRLSADLGDSMAKGKLGFHYVSGLFGLGKIPEGVKLLRSTAAQANGEAQYTAQYNLGVCYERGIGVVPDRSEARRWYSLSANQGFEPAKKNLSIINSHVGRSEWQREHDEALENRRAQYLLNGQ